MTDKYYVSGVIKIEGTCGRVADEDAEFWTVYEVQADGRSLAICDCYSREKADEIARRMMAMEGVSNLNLEGGWSAKGLSDYAKSLEAQLTELAKQEPATDEANHCASVLEYIGQFESEDIDSDTVDLRFEIDGVDTGSDVSITEYATRSAKVIRGLLSRAAPVKLPKSQRLDGNGYGYYFDMNDVFVALDEAGIKYKTSDGSVAYE